MPITLARETFKSNLVRQMGSIKQSKPSRWATLQKVEWAAHDDEHDDGPHLSPQNHYGPAFMHVHRSLTQLSHPMRMGVSLATSFPTHRAAAFHPHSISMKTHAYS
jgi:hypothetical protein